MVAVGGRQNHSCRPDGPEHVVIADREADDLAHAVAPGARLRVPPAAISKMPDGDPARADARRPRSGL